MFKDSWKDPVHGKKYSLDSVDGKWKDSEGRPVPRKEEQSKWTKEQERAVDGDTKIDRRQLIRVPDKLAVVRVRTALDIIHTPKWKFIKRWLLKRKLKKLNGRTS